MPKKERKRDKIADMTNLYPLPNWPRELLLVIRLSFWFACFWTVIGTLWRPPLASLGLLFIFLVLTAVVEWLSRQLNPKYAPAESRLMPSDTPNAPWLQKMTRIKTEEGLDRLEGTFLAEFPEGAATTTVHIAFCPAFEQTPTIQIFPLGDIPDSETDSSFRIVQSKPYGVRIDVKRTDLHTESDTDRMYFTIVAEGETPG